MDKTNTRGLPSRQENRFGEGRYHLSFWSVPYRNATGCMFRIPYMMRYGGNLVVLLPNGVSAFRLADGHHYEVDTMVLAGEAIRPFPCPLGSGEAPPLERQRLTASELTSAFPGHTFYGDLLNRFPEIFGGHFNMFVSADGVLYGMLTAGPDGSTEHDVGTWHIAADGQFCRTWNVWDNRRDRCYTTFHAGETFELLMTDQWRTEIYRRVPGNPEGY